MSSHNKDKVKDKDKEKRDSGMWLFQASRSVSRSTIRIRRRVGCTQTEGETPVAMLSEQVRNLQAEKQELMNTMVRRQADFENYRKRVEKERHHDRHRAVESLIEGILPVLDAFDRALERPMIRLRPNTSRDSS